LNLTQLLRVAAASLLVLLPWTQATAQGQADLIAAAISTHNDSSPASIWKWEEWPGMTVEEFLTLLPEAAHGDIGSAWAAAGEGKGPFPACNALFHNMAEHLRDVAADAKELTIAFQAIDACHVAVLPRYLLVRAAADSGCTGAMPTYRGQRSVASSLLGDVDPEGRIIAYLDTRLETVIGNQVRIICPDIAPWILGP
jgi:hypothetical protein